MSELREECYKCLNNQSCISGADYGSIYCSLNRKFKMPGKEDDSVYAIKFATMQKQIDKKDKKIARLEEEKEYLIKLANNKQWFSPYYVAQNYISKQKIKDKIEELNKEEQELQNNISEEEREKYSDANISYLLCDIEIRIQALQELLQEENK